ncbi:hypothetical protein [Pedobacter rhizosphaerae]|uniref:Uncharacterized protein n=1 Tax=Pedobacter rhizosphaerae TaxID=390241 RepID=A0A1H9R0X2_9SPHI|nr:hypothetical protein [Pedobacter rhizosphaerae]SER66267.1 hypothetical protein SAMN04488023_11376 [Pedobacter rhizosphaerae]
MHKRKLLLPNNIYKSNTISLGHFKGIVKKGYTDEEVVEHSKNFAQSQLETELLEAKEKADEMEKDVNNKMIWWWTKAVIIAITGIALIFF